MTWISSSYFVQYHPLQYLVLTSKGNWDMIYIQGKATDLTSVTADMWSQVCQYAISCMYERIKTAQKKGESNRTFCKKGWKGSLLTLNFR